MLTIAAAVMLLTNALKLAWPTAPAWAVLLTALGLGVGGALLDAWAGGGLHTPALVRDAIVTGIAYALAAAGLDRTAGAVRRSGR